MFSYTDDSLATDDYSDLETPVSTRSYFRNIHNLGEIQESLGSDSGRQLMRLFFGHFVDAVDFSKSN